MAHFLYSNFLFCLQQKTEIDYSKDLILQVKCIKYLLIFRSGGPDVFCKNVFLEISQNSWRNTCARASILIKLQAQVFSCDFSKFLRIPFLTEHLRWLFLYMAVLFLVTLLLILKICLKVDINFWKTPLRITFNNLRSCQANICGRVPYQLKLCLCSSQ